MILTGFQLRAARKVLNLTIDQLHIKTGVSKITLSRLENKTLNLEYIKCSTIDMKNITDYFTQQHIVFLNEKTIELDIEIENRPIQNNLTRFQLIVSRCAIRLNQEELSEYLNLSQSTLNNYELKQNIDYIKIQKVNIESIISFFKSHGILFARNLSVTITKNI